MRFYNFFFCLFAVSRSVRFGKFGGRCKSSQCRGCVQRGFLFMLVVVRCRLLQWDQSAKEAMVPTLIVPYRGGTGVSAHQPFNDPWLMSQQLPDKTTANQRPPKNKQTNKQNISGAATRVWFFFSFFKKKIFSLSRASRTTFKLSPEALRQLILSVESPTKRSCVTVRSFEFFAKRTGLVLGLHCPFWPHGTSHDRTLHGLHRPWPLKVTATRHLGARTQSRGSANWLCQKKKIK